MKILIMKFRNIGDVLLITPLLYNLRYHYPNAQIDVSVNKGTEAMLEGNPAINHIFIYNRAYIKSLPLMRKISAEINFATTLFKQKYDIAINLTKGDRGTLLTWVSRAKFRIGYRSKNYLATQLLTHILPPQLMRHTVECNLDPLKILGLPIISAQVNVSYTPQEILKFQNFSNFIHIHPVSRWLFKCIDNAIMAHIIDYCQNDLKIPVILTASSDSKEMQKIMDIITLCKTSPINLAGELSLKETVALNSKARLFIGVDTAIMHISAANNIPVLAFFGPSAAYHWGPWDNSHTSSSYHRKNGFQSMGIHRVIQQNWNCVPCSQDGCNGSKISDCLMQKGLYLNTITQNIKEMIHD